MLMVKAVLGPSTVHGIGLFAAEDIAKGTIVWRFDPGIDRLFTRAERDTAPPATRAFLETYSYPYRPGADVHILDGDHARFMNHSPDPNTDNNGEYTIASRDIAAGEELLCNYNEFYPGNPLV
ncbi:SET domain-containing protein [Azospirillum sp. sgz302134]